MDEEKVKEVFSDEEFVRELLQLETPLEVQTALKEKGVDMTEAEIIELRDKLVEFAEKVNKEGELSLDELDDAAGGVVSLFVTSMFVGTSIVAGGHAIIGAGLIAAAGATMAATVAAAGVGTLGVAAGIGMIGAALTRSRW